MFYHKQICLEAVEAKKPCDIRYGQVVSDVPLAIKITDKFILPETLLLVPDHLRNKTQTKTYIESYKNWENAYSFKDSGVGDGDSPCPDCTIWDDSNSCIKLPMSKLHNKGMYVLVLYDAATNQLHIGCPS